MKFGTNWTCWTSSRSTGQTFERSFRYSENKSDFQNYANKSRFSNEFPESFTKQNQKYFFLWDFYGIFDNAYVWVPTRAVSNVVPNPIDPG